MVEAKWNFKGNYGKDLKCALCKQEDTTEHILECNSLIELKAGYGDRVLSLNEPDKYLAEYIEEAIKIRKLNGFSIEFGN